MVYKLKESISVIAEWKWEILASNSEIRGGTGQRRKKKNGKEE